MKNQCRAFLCEKQAVGGLGFCLVHAHHAERQFSPALAHAETLAHAATELLRYAREGASTPSFPFGMDDIVAGIAEVLAWALEVEAESDDGRRPANLRAALQEWLTAEGITT